MDSELERREDPREEMISRLSEELRGDMAKIYGEQLGTGADTLPGIPNEDLSLECAAKIYQMLAALHEDGDWKDGKGLQLDLEASLRRNNQKIGSSEHPRQETEILFSGNDKYGLIYGLGFGQSENIPAEQMDRETERLYNGWYVELFNRYINERPKEMYPIAKKIEEAGLPLLPSIQSWMRRFEAGFLV